MAALVFMSILLHTASAQTQSAASCLPSLITPPPSGSVCGPSGYIYQEGISLQTFHNTVSLEQCIVNCDALGPDACQAIAYYPPGGTGQEPTCFFTNGTSGVRASAYQGNSVYEVSCFSSCDSLQGICPPPFAVAPTCSAGELIQNGGFEDNTGTPWFFNDFAPELPDCYAAYGGGSASGPGGSAAGGGYISGGGRRRWRTWIPNIWSPATTFRSCQPITASARLFILLKLW